MISGKEGLLLRIFVGSTDKRDGMPLFEWIIRKARERGLSGATALRGKEGFGAHRNVHGAEILSLSKDQPVVIVPVIGHLLITKNISRAREVPELEKKQEGPGDSSGNLIVGSSRSRRRIKW